MRNPASPNNTDLSLNSTLVSAGNWDSLAIGKDGYTYAWGYNGYGQLGNNSYKDAYAPVLVEFNLSRVISAARFDTSPGTNLTNISNSNSVTVLTPGHLPGTVIVSVDYTMGGSGQTLTDTSFKIHVPVCRRSSPGRRGRNHARPGHRHNQHGRDAGLPPPPERATPSIARFT